MRKRRLVLNGAGLRKRAVLPGLRDRACTPEKTARRDAIGAAGAKRIAIHMLRDVDAGRRSPARSPTACATTTARPTMKALEPRIAQLGAIMAEMKEAKKGMAITLDWSPGAARR